MRLWSQSFGSCSKGKSNTKGNETGDRERSRETTSKEYDKNNAGSVLHGLCRQRTSVLQSTSVLESMAGPRGDSGAGVWSARSTRRREHDTKREFVF